MAVGFASPAMADDAPRAAAPVPADKLLDTKTVNDSSASLKELQEVADVDINGTIGTLTGVAREARLAVENTSENATEAVENADVDAAGKVNQDAKARGLGAMPHLGGLPIG